jgi:ectoine hydroxylase-related dioxygenase (phytanoyl-CoA dioxygenase family)
MVDLTPQQVAQYNEDGFLIVERAFDPALMARVAARYEGLFRGQFETGLVPDEWNWKEGRDSNELSRQICNGWRSDYTVASLVLSAEVGRMVATLEGWPGARIAQDNIIWKPPGAKPLGFHQDDSYNGWMVPSHMASCWIALDRTTAAGGTVEYVRGSHKWPVSPPIGEFHAPKDYRMALRQAAEKVGIDEIDLVPVEVPAGGCAFHHGGTWHGSDTNRSDRARLAAVAHCMSSEAVFHPTSKSYVYNRYKRVGDTTMDESFFPILWRKDGYRTPWLDEYCRQGSASDIAPAKLASAR